jgi:hypothetical protein
MTSAAQDRLLTLLFRARRISELTDLERSEVYREFAELRKRDRRQLLITHGVMKEYFEPALLAMTAFLQRSQEELDEVLRKQRELDEALDELAQGELAPPRTQVETVIGHSDPPKGFAFLLACAAGPERAEEKLGDAETEYRRMIARFGVTRARWWYRVTTMKRVFEMLPSVLIRVWILYKLLRGL